MGTWILTTSLPLQGTNNRPGLATVLLGVTGLASLPEVCSVPGQGLHAWLSDGRLLL